jgi:hypothetical protein
LQERPITIGPLSSDLIDPYSVRATNTRESAAHAASDEAMTRSVFPSM